jgi:hypothetical protein
MDHKQSVNKKQNKVHSPASSGGKGKYMKYISSPWPPLEAAMSILKFKLLY